MKRAEHCSREHRRTFSQDEKTDNMNFLSQLFQLVYFVAHNCSWSAFLEKLKFQQLSSPLKSRPEIVLQFSKESSSVPGELYSLTNIFQWHFGMPGCRTDRNSVWIRRHHVKNVLLGHKVARQIFLAGKAQTKR